MKRRDLSLSLASVLASACLSWPAAQAQTAPRAGPLGQKPEAGTDFLALSKPAPVEAAAGKIEVIEFFSYDCPHCNAFEPALVAWIKRAPKDVAIKRVPVPFVGAIFERRQRLYYTLEAMKLVDQLHDKVFHAIHVEQLRLDGDDALMDWIVKQGVDRAAFAAQYQSFSVSSKITRASRLADAYKISGVPSLGIAGRFYTDGTLANGMERGLLVADYLIGEVRKGR